MYYRVVVVVVVVYRCVCLRFAIEAAGSSSPQRLKEKPFNEGGEEVIQISAASHQVQSVSRRELCVLGSSSLFIRTYYM